MASVNDWAAKAAKRIVNEYGINKTHSLTREYHEDRIAAIIATFAEPLMKAVRDSKWQHSKGYNEESADYPPCKKSYEDGEDEICSCGADEHNARIDKVLAGES